MIITFKVTWVRWPIAMAWRPSLTVVRHPLTTSSQELLGQSWPHLVSLCSICRVRRQEIMNFIAPTPRGDNFGIKSLKLMYFSQNLFHSCAWIRQTKCKVMMTKERLIKICKFHAPWGRGSCTGAWQYKTYSEIVCHCWFLFIPWLGSWYANISPSDKKWV